MRLPRLLDLAPPAPGAQAPCRCGHVTIAHEHYRRGSDCALCECGRYRRLSTGRVATQRSPRPLPVVRPYAVAPGGAHERPGAA